MHLAYYDEAGDDGYPNYSSPLFVLTTLYLHYLNWKDTYEALRDFRRAVRAKYRLPIKTEWHTRQFFLNKNPFRPLNLSDQDRTDIVSAYCDVVAQLNAQIVNVTIVKPRIKKAGYQVLDTAFKYSIQRIENDLDPRKRPENKFLIVTDSGRVGKMRKTSRRIQRINYIPSHFGAQPYRQEIQSLIEDPLPKDSRESYFIQTCDLVSYIVYLHCLTKTKAGSFPNRMPATVTPAQVTNWMDRLKPSLNLKASGADPHGIVVHPP